MAENDTASEDLVKLLPPELWQCIASHMDLRTWARTAAPTCKTLWSLQQLHLTCTGDETGDLLTFLTVATKLLKALPSNKQ